MFQAIIAQDYSKLQHIGLKFYKEDNKPAALLCLDHIFARPPRIQCGSIAETISSLEMFYGYTRLLHDIACLPNPCNGRSVQKLFAFEIARENIFSVAQGALLHRQVGHQGALFFNEKNGKLLVPGSELARVLKGALGERLRSRVMEENKICRAAAVFTPCPHGTMDACSQSNCPRDHFNPATMTPDHYNERVRIHFQQIQIFQTLHFVDLGPERDANQRCVFRLKNNKIIRANTKILDIGLIDSMKPSILDTRLWVVGPIWTYQRFPEPIEALPS